MTKIYFNNRITNKIQSIIFRSRQQFFITTEFENQIDMHFNYRATTIGTSGQVINELPVLTFLLSNTQCVEGVYVHWPKQSNTGVFRIYF